MQLDASTLSAPIPSSKNSTNGDFATGSLVRRHCDPQSRLKLAIGKRNAPTLSCWTTTAIMETFRLQRQRVHPYPCRRLDRKTTGLPRDECGIDLIRCATRWRTGLDAERAEEPDHDQDNQYKAKNAPATRPSIAIVAVITTPAANQDYQKNDDKNRGHVRLPSVNDSTLISGDSADRPPLVYTLQTLFAE